MNLQQMVRAHEELTTKVEALEAEMVGHNRRIKRMERVWHRFRARMGIPRHVSEPMRIPQRPACLKALGKGHDLKEGLADAGR